MTFDALQNFAGHAGERWDDTIVPYLSPAWPAKFWRGLYVAKLLTTCITTTFSIKQNMDFLNGDPLLPICSNA